MQKKAGNIILALTLLALVSAGVLTVRFLTYSITPAPPAQAAELPVTGAMPAPELPRISSPRAIVVLDVSGSMGLTGRPSDPDRLQTVAMLQLYDTYLGIAREILGEGDEAGLAVMLFGTVAQTIAWDDDSLFLPVTEENRDRFRDVVTHYLGAPRGTPGDDLPDPRRSQDSDYAAALVAVEGLVDGLTSPPAVIFMTDGRMVIHPCFTPLLPENQRNRMRGCRGGVDVPAHLSAATLPPIFNRRDGDRPINRIDVPASLDPEAEVIQIVRRLLSRRFPDSVGSTADGPAQAPLAWIPMHLDIRGRFVDQRDVRRPLDCDDVSRRYWHLPEGFVHCPEAGDLVREFQVALARWLRLFEHPLAPGETRFTTPAGTRFIVVQVETDRPVASLRLVRDGRTVDLQGRGRFWSGVINGDCDGQWTVTPSDAATIEATVFFGLRYDWALTAPNVCVEGTSGDNPRALLSLCRTTDLAPIAGRDVYDTLPSVLTGTVTPSGSTPLVLEFRRVAAAQNDRGQTYQAEIPVADIREGSAQIAVQLDTLQSAGIPVRRTELTREITVEARTRIVIEDNQGRQADRIRLENVPRAPDWARSMRRKTP